MSLVRPVAVLLPGAAGEKPAKRLEVAVKDPAQPSTASSRALVQCMWHCRNVDEPLQLFVAH